MTYPIESIPDQASDQKDLVSYQHSETIRPDYRNMIITKQGKKDETGYYVKGIR